MARYVKNDLVLLQGNNKALTKIESSFHWIVIKTLKLRISIKQRNKKGHKVKIIPKR